MSKNEHVDRAVAEAKKWGANPVQPFSQMRAALTDFECFYALGYHAALVARDAELDRLRGALREARAYVEHSTLCSYHAPSHGERWCDCGLSNFLTNLDTLTTPTAPHV